MGNAEIGYLTNWTSTIFNNILSLGGGGGSDTGSSNTKEQMEYFMGNLPDNFQMIDINDRAAPLLTEEAGPFVVVITQECQRMNGLLSEIRRSLIELDKGLKGQLNMSQAMEDLMAEFLDMKARISQLESWSADLITPFSVWLPGLFNPTSYLTAVMQVTARRTMSPLDCMTTEPHVTTFTKFQEIDYYPEDGAFMHGLF